MVQFECRLLRGLLGFICLLPICISASPERCVSLRTVKDSLNITLRRRFMKMNFPINYTIQVPYEEVYRLHNISRLREDELVKPTHLQDLWLYVSLEGIKRVLRVLPERHPTRRKYLFHLENLFKKFEEVYYQQYQGEEDESELPESIQTIWDHLKDQNYQGWKSVTPKSILDNCYRTMLCLFKDCFPKNDDDETDHCDVKWRKGKKTS